MGKKLQHGRIGQSAIKVKMTVILKLKKKIIWYQIITMSVAPTIIALIRLGKKAWSS